MAKDSPISDSITAQLRSRMEAQGISSFRALAQSAGVSEGQILQFRRGKAGQMRLVMLQNLAEALQLSLPECLSLAEAQSPAAPSELPPALAADNALQAEYDRLQQQLARQETELRQRFQQESLYALEAWMKNWPKVVHAVQTHKPDLLAAKILPLVKPLEQLLDSWGVETVGCMGKPLAYDPQFHQLVRGQAQPGETVTVLRPGFRQENRLLHRAEVGS